MIGTFWTHKKTGHFYRVLASCTVEKTMEAGLVYQRVHAPDSEDDGRVWVRPQSEFLDGRFVPCCPHDHSQSDGPTSRSTLEYLTQNQTLLAMLSTEIGERALKSDPEGDESWFDIGLDSVKEMLTWPLDDGAAVRGGEH